MAYTIHCGQPWPHEVKAFHEIEYVLQNDRDWIIITNSGAHEPDTNETNILLVGRLGIIVVELKHWAGHVTSHLNAPWTIKYSKGTEELRKNPLDQAREAMFKLRKAFTDFGIDGRDYFISYMVVTTHPESQLSASSPKVANLVTSLTKFRPSLYEHIRVHQRPINERNFGPDHIERLLNALEIDYKDIRRALDYLHEKHKPTRVHSNLSVPTHISDEANPVVEPKDNNIAQPASENEPLFIHAVDEQKVVTTPEIIADPDLPIEDALSQINVHAARLTALQIAQHASSFPVGPKVRTAIQASQSLPDIEKSLPVQIRIDAKPETKASTLQKQEAESVPTAIKPARIVEESIILQSFSHGRSKNVKVEVHKSSLRRRSRLYDLN